MEDKNLAMAKRVAAAVADAGGKTYYVGGFVRDRLLGIPNKDVDIEVHGIPVATLEKILDGLGERLTKGVSFGILGLSHYDLDIAMPRSEVATGRGHKDFTVFVDPFIGEEKAARRRDFTINALMQDVLSEEVLDFFGGKDDLARRCIRHVDPKTFVEDPLRVFRAAQFAARFDFEVAPDTVELSSTMDLSALSRERVMGELSKALLKASRPSVFFEELRKMRQLWLWFPEVEALWDVPQDAIHHPEGTVWNHTMLVIDETARLLDQATYPLGLMLAAVCHDLGKAVTTQEKDGRLHAYGHEVEGIPITQTLLKRLTNETRLIRYVCNMVELHMRPNLLVANNAKTKSFMRTFDTSCCPNDLLLLAKADSLGRADEQGHMPLPEEGYRDIEQRLGELFAEYERRMAAPYVTGNDLIEAGYEPGPLFSEALAYAHKLRLAGIGRDEQLSQTLGYMRSL